jgi:hypothetical protein
MITTSTNQSNPQQTAFEDELKAVFEAIEKDFAKMPVTGKTGKQIEKLIGEMFG